MSPLDSRTWLVWAVCAMIPMLIGRHPVLVLAMLCIALTVRLVCVPPAAIRWGWIVRISVVFAAIGVLFNALTVRSGNQVAFNLPLLGWDITWNAITYGVVSGVAVITLVLIGNTAAAGLDWIALTRVLPPRVAPLAVSGSVAWSFLPAASQAYTDIREAQAARGHRIRSVRHVLPILVPLLDGSLNRALTMSETLEARGFGASVSTTPAKTSVSLFGMMTIFGALCLAFAISMNARYLLWISLVVTAVGAIGFARSGANTPPTTRYREHKLTRADIGVMAASLVSLIVILFFASQDYRTIIFNPYPNLEVPAIDFRILLALIPLLGPALFPYEARPS